MLGRAYNKEDFKKMTILKMKSHNKHILQSFKEE